MNVPMISVPTIKRKYRAILLLVFCPHLFFCATSVAQGKAALSLGNEHIRISWQKGAKGWQISQLSVRKGQQWIAAANPTGENTLLYSADMPAKAPDTIFQTITGVN